MDNQARQRAKDHFPAVLLTLLSIVQAIALELLWGHVIDAAHLRTLTLDGLVGWGQVLATLLGIVLVWVVYAGNVMRFRWVPAITDSVYPFLIGIIEFAMVELLQSGSPGLWLLALGFAFGVMTWISQITMRRARYDDDNAQFFQGIPKATLADFYPQIVAFGVFACAGFGLAIFDPGLMVVGPVVLAALIFLLRQFRISEHFWNTSMALPAGR